MLHDESVRQLPPGWRRWLGGGWQQDELGCSDTAVYRLPQTAWGGVGYVKMDLRDGWDPPSRERDVLLWLQGRLPVPQVWGYGEVQQEAFLLMSAVPGWEASDERWHDDPTLMVDALAAGLRQIHALDIRDCPFDQRLAAKLAEAKRRVLAGAVDESDFEPQYLGCSASVLYEELLATCPMEEDLVFTHGDYCLPNVLLDDGGVTGFIDWGWAGVADRYQDLALAVRSLGYNLGDARWGERFLRAYGLKDVDRERMRFYVLLDEFF